MQLPSLFVSISGINTQRNTPIVAILKLCMPDKKNDIIGYLGPAVHYLRGGGGGGGSCIPFCCFYPYR